MNYQGDQRREQTIVPRHLPRSAIRRHEVAERKWFIVANVLLRLRALRGQIVLIALAASFSWCGCVLGPDYKQPAVSIPPQFRSGMAQDGESIGDLRWFEVFNDEYLQELIRIALVQNYDLRDAIARVEAARANVGITRADQFPNFGI